jgi:uncharacterized phage protein (TIGR01671 family)
MKNWRFWKMREIEFRIYNSEFGELQTVTELGFDDDGRLDYLESRGEDGKTYGFATRLDDLGIMQYTGLKDKNGKKIFDGDIGWDDHNECYGVVTFDEGKFKYVWETVSDDLWEVTDDIEIKGNKWQNPELLEEV